MKIDLHLHTTGSDGRSPAHEIVERVIAAGLDGFCITDHHKVRTPESDECAALAKRCGLKVFRGVEYSSAGGHILLYGVTDQLVQTFGRYQDPQIVIDEVNRAKGAAVVSHPFKGYRLAFNERVQHLKGLAAWEAYNGQCCYQAPEANQKAYRLGYRLGRPMTGGSDAHDARDIGLAWTNFDDTFATDKLLVKALKSRKVLGRGFRPHVNESRVRRYRLWRETRGDLGMYGGDATLDMLTANRQRQPGETSQDPGARYFAGPDFADAKDWTVEHVATLGVEPDDR